VLAHQGLGRKSQHPFVRIDAVLFQAWKDLCALFLSIGL
jgi:hypothetical protein